MFQANILNTLADYLNARKIDDKIALNSALLAYEASLRPYDSIINIKGISLIL